MSTCTHGLHDLSPRPHSRLPAPGLPLSPIPTAEHPPMPRQPRCPLPTHWTLAHSSWVQSVADQRTSISRDLCPQSEQAAAPVEVGRAHGVPGGRGRVPARTEDMATLSPKWGLTRGCCHVDPAVTFRSLKMVFDSSRRCPGTHDDAKNSLWQGWRGQCSPLPRESCSAPPRQHKWAVCGYRGACATPRLPSPPLPTSLHPLPIFSSLPPGLADTECGLSVRCFLMNI